MTWQPIADFDEVAAKKGKQIVAFTRGAGKPVFIANYTGGGNPYEPGPWRYFCVVEFDPVPDAWEDRMESVLAELSEAIKGGKLDNETQKKLGELLPKAVEQWEAKPK